MGESKQNYVRLLSKKGAMTCVWLLAAVWIAFGLWMKVLAWIGGQHDVFANGLGYWANAVIIVFEFCLLIAVYALRRLLIMRYVLLWVYACFIVAHILVLSGVMPECGCFAGLYMPTWFILLINALLFLGLLLSVRSEIILTPKSTSAIVHGVVMGLAIFFSYTDYRPFNEPDLVVDGISRAQFMKQLKVGEDLDSLSYASPLLDVLGQRHGLKTAKTRLYLYDSSCAHCQDLMPEMMNRALDDIMFTEYVWMFVNVGYVSDPSASYLNKYGTYMHVSDSLFKVPLFIELNNGVIEDVNIFDNN